MGTIIEALVLVLLSVAAVAYAVDKIEQSLADKRKEIRSDQTNQKKLPDDMVDLSGGMYGI
jgi:hypothetical protein